MPVSIDGVDLLGAQESNAQATAQVDVTSAPGQGDEETLLVSLESQESPAVSGRATGIRLTSQSGYSSDPETALAQWVQQFESLANAEQGAGYTLTDDERDRQIRTIVGSVGWTYSATAPFEVSWTLEGERGEGVLDDVPRDPSTATPNSAETLGGTDLGHIDEKRTELTVDLGTFPIAYGDESDSVITPGSGVVRQISVSGRVGGSTSELRTFDDTLRSYLGDNQSFTYQTAFPGTEHSVVVDGYDSTFGAGDPHTLRYTLTVYAGLNL